MSRAIVTESKLTAIADAIRAKTGEQGELILDEMATAIENLPSGSSDFIQSTSMNRLIVTEVE